MNLETMVESKQLVERWADLHRLDPHLRQRDGAAKLGITESELLAAHVGRGAVRLAADWQAILPRLTSVGPVTALSRNEYAVIEKVGSYSKIEFHGPMGQVLDPGIDLRLFLSHWHVAFALTEETSRGVRRSLQVFDAFGTAIHKIFLGPDSDVEAFAALVEVHESRDQEPTQTVRLPTARIPECSDDAVDVRALRQGWSELEDTHDFIHLLRRTGVARTQALRLAGPEWAERVALPSHRAVLQQAAESELPIMVFVGNQGIIQIHGGPIRTVKEVGGWFNVLDPGFNLHLREAGVSAAWVVRKPTRDGTVTSLEIYDAVGEMVAYFFSKRKPGQAEIAPWRELLGSLERTGAPA